MRILDRAVYVGPSLYAHFPVIRLEVDLGPLEAWPSARLGPAFTDRLIEALPGLHEHGCSYGEPGGNGATGRYDVIYQYEQEDVGLEAGRLGMTLLHSLLPPDLRPEGSVPGDFDFAAERDEFIRFAQRRALGPSTMSLVRAAEERRIPWIRL